MLLWVIAAVVAIDFAVEKDQAISAAITVVVAIVIHLLWRKMLGVKKKSKKTVADDKKVAPEEPVSESDLARRLTLRSVSFFLNPR